MHQCSRCKNWRERDPGRFYCMWGTVVGNRICHEERLACLDRKREMGSGQNLCLETLCRVYLNTNNPYPRRSSPRASHAATESCTSLMKNMKLHGGSSLLGVTRVLVVGPRWLLYLALLQFGGSQCQVTSLFQAWFSFPCK